MGEWRLINWANLNKTSPHIHYNQPKYNAHQPKNQNWKGKWINKAYQLIWIVAYDTSTLRFLNILDGFNDHMFLCLLLGLKYRHFIGPHLKFLSRRKKQLNGPAVLYCFIYRNGCSCTWIDLPIALVTKVFFLSVSRENIGLYFRTSSQVIAATPL